MKNSILFLIPFLLFFHSCRKENKSISAVNNVKYEHTKKNYSDNFDKIKSLWQKEIVSEKRINIVKDPLNSTNNVIQFNLQLDDWVSGGKRSELYFRPKDSFGYKSQYSFKFLLPESFFKKGEKKGAIIIHQWHDMPMPGFNWATYNRKTKPPIHLMVEHNPNGDYYLIFKSGLEMGNLHEIISSRWKEKMKPNKWYTFSCEILWSFYNNVGYSRPKLDDKYFVKGQQHKIFRRNMYNSIPNYYKFGLYRGSHEDYERTIYFDDFKFSSKRIQ